MAVGSNILWSYQLSCLSFASLPGSAHCQNSDHAEINGARTLVDVSLALNMRHGAFVTRLARVNCACQRADSLLSEKGLVLATFLTHRKSGSSLPDSDPFGHIPQKLASTRSISVLSLVTCRAVASLGGGISDAYAEARNRRRVLHFTKQGLSLLSGLTPPTSSAGCSRFFVLQSCVEDVSHRAAVQLSSPS